MSEGGRRLRARGDQGPKGPGRAHQRGGKTPRNRLGSVSCSNEESTEGEDETVVRKVCVNNNRLKVDHSKDGERGRGGHTRKRSSRISNGLVRLFPSAEEDVIDGFLFLSFSTIAEMEKDTKGNVDNIPDVGDILTDAVSAQEEETKEEEVVEGEIRNGISEHFAGFEPLISKDDIPSIVNGGIVKDEEIGENNNVPTTPNQNFLVTQPVVAMPPKSQSMPLPREPLRTKEMNGAMDSGQPYKKICDTAEEAKKVPPDLEASRPETPKQDAVHLQSKKSPPYPLKTTPSPYLPAQNGPPNEPSAAVAAVTVPTSAVPSHHQPTHQSSSTSPAGGVPFPTSLQDHFETIPKTHNSPPQQKSTGSDAAHPYPVCADYTVNYSYANSKQQQQHYQEGGQRAHGKVVTNNSYYNHHPTDSSNKYPKEVGQRSNSNDSNCDGYENYHGGRYESSKAAELSGYQAYEKSCDPICKKPSSNANSVYNFKTNQLLTNENLSKTGGEKVGGKVTGDLYSNVSKAKIPNRTTYYQSIVNKSHSRHKSSRRVLPASAYENTKPVINNYPSSKSELAQVQPTKTVQYAPHHYPPENKKHDYYQPLSVANTGTTNTYNCSTYKTDPSQTHVNNNTGHSNYPSESQSSGSRNYKTSTDHSLGSYRDKQPLPTVGSTGTKSYNYHNNSSSRNYVDASSNKVSSDTVPGYGNSDYYHKGSVSYSRSGGVNPSAISDNTYKNSNHTGDHSTAYQSKNSSYHHSRTSSEKGGRNYYANQEGSYKSYRQDLVPKQNSDESHGYRSTHEGIPYLNHGNSSSSLKSKEITPHGVVEPSKTAPVESVRNVQTEPIPIHPPNSDTTTHQSTTSRETKPTFYPYADPAYYNHQRTPPLPSSKQSYEPIAAPTKDSEAFRLLGSSSTTAISSYPQPRPTTPPVQDNSRNGTTTTTAKTLWSPTATTTTTTASATNREIVAASSRDSHSSHSNSSISSLSQLSQSLGPQGKEPVVVNSKEFQNREGGRSSSNGHSRSSSGNETPVYSSAAAVTTITSTSTNSSSTAYGVSGSLTSLIFSKASWTSPSASSVLTSPSSSHFTSSSHLGSSPVPSVLPLAPSLPSSSGHPPFGPAGGPHVMFAPPLPHAPGSSPLATGPSPFGGDSLFAPPPPPPSTDLLNIRRELDTRFLASQDRSIAVPPPPYLRAEMHQHQHQHTHMHQHSPFLPPPLGLPPSAAAHPLYDKFPKVDSSFYGRNALGIPTYPISPLLAPGSATATPTPFAPPGHMAAFQPKISPLVKAKTLKSGRWCAMHVRISWEIYRHQQKHLDPQKGGTKGVGDLLRPPNHLFGGALPRPHELGFSPSPLMGAAGSIHARSPYDVSPQHPSFLGPTPAHLGISPFSRPNYPSIGVPGNSFGGLGGLGLTGAAGLLAGGRGAELGPGGYLGMDPWGRLHRTPPNFPSPSSVGGPPGGSWGGLKAEADRMQQKRSEDHHEREKEKQKRAEIEKKESEKSKEMARESKKEHDKQKERDRESRVSHVSSHPEPLRNGETTTTDSRNSSSGNHRERDWERARERTRESSRSPLRTHKPPPDGGDVKVKEEEKKEEEKAASPERTKSVGGVELPSHQDMAMDYLARFPMAEQAARLASMTQIPPPHPSHFWNHQSAERYRSLELQEQLMQKYASLASVMPPLERSFREAELARHLASTSEIERQLQADRDRQLYERSGKLPPPPLRPNDYVPPPAGLFPHLPFMSYPPRTKTNSPAAGNNGIPPPLIPCQSPGVTPPSPLKHGGGAEAGREHYPASKASHSSEVVESQSR